MSRAGPRSRPDRWKPCGGRIRFGFDRSRRSAVGGRRLCANDPLYCQHDDRIAVIVLARRAGQRAGVKSLATLVLSIGPDNGGRKAAWAGEKSASSRSAPSGQMQRFTGSRPCESRAARKCAPSGRAGRPAGGPSTADVSAPTPRSAPRNFSPRKLAQRRGLSVGEAAAQHMSSAAPGRASHSARFGDAGLPSGRPATRAPRSLHNEPGRLRTVLARKPFAATAGTAASLAAPARLLRVTIGRRHFLFPAPVPMEFGPSRLASGVRARFAGPIGPATRARWPRCPRKRRRRGPARGRFRGRHPNWPPSRS